MALLTPLGIELYNEAGARERSARPLLGGTSTWRTSAASATSCSRRSTQPETAALWRRHLPAALVALSLAAEVLEGVERIQILACGTSYAAQVGAYLLEQLAGIPTSVFYASEFVMPPPLSAHTLTIGDPSASGRGPWRWSRDGGGRWPIRRLRRGWGSPTGRRVPWAGWWIRSSMAPASRWAWRPPRFLGQLLAFYGLALAFAERRGGGATGHGPEQLRQLAAGLGPCRSNCRA